MIFILKICAPRTLALSLLVHSDTERPVEMSGFDKEMIQQVEQS